MPSKFESQSPSLDWVSHEYSKIYVVEPTTGAPRLKIAASEFGTKVLGGLTEALDGPFSLLYLLVVPRGGSRDGRYQSPWMNRSELNDFLGRYSEFLEQDGRHHLWLFSHPEKATLVYDRHNVIYAYGPIARLEKILAKNGYAKSATLNFPAPHSHCYHAEFDDPERDIVGLPGWARSDLRDGDEI
jgi:hypothetical protein